MGQVWRQPSVTGLEVLWRWAAGAPLLAILAVELLRVERSVAVDGSALASVTVFQPVAAFHTFDTVLATVLPSLRGFALWLLPLWLVVWIVAGALGRARVLRRLYPWLAPARPFNLMALGALRTAVLALVWALWALGVRWAGQIAILGPARHGGEPSVVGYCALLIGGTLGLFAAWAVGSWIVHLAPLEAMLGGRARGAAASLRAAQLAGRNQRALRAKLIETNLVMGIVKIALLVLAMVFSACPLPFSSVETPAFLAAWWSGVVLLYLAAMDFFHVAHAAAYLELWRAYQSPARSVNHAATAR